MGAHLRLPRPQRLAIVARTRWRNGYGWFQRAGDQHVRTRKFLLGSAVVLWGVKGRSKEKPPLRSTRSRPEAGGTGGRSCTPPYTVWHLSYVAIGAATAAEVDLYRLGMSLLGFFLGVGLAAHALDELRGRPFGTSISDRVLQALAIVSLAGAAAVGVVGIVQVSAWLAVFIVAGAFPWWPQPRTARQLVPLGSVVRDRMGRIPRAHRSVRPRGEA